MNGTLLLHPGTPTQVLLDMLLGPAPRVVQVNDRGHVIGQDHPGSKLSDHDVYLIHALRAEGVLCREIARKFEVSVHTVHSISAGRRRGQTACGQKTMQPRG